MYTVGLVNSALQFQLKQLHVGVISLQVIAAKFCVRGILAGLFLHFVGGEGVVHQVQPHQILWLTGCMQAPLP